MKLFHNFLVKDMLNISIILFILCILIVKKQWKIIVILVFIYYFFQIEETQKKIIVPTYLDDIKQFNKKINPNDDYYFRTISKLESLKDKYPHGVVQREQVKVINQMLYNKDIMTNEEEARWNKIRLDILEKGVGGKY